MSRTSGSFRGVSYRNGRMPSSALSRLDGLHGSSRTLPAYLRKDAADAFNRARAEIEARFGETLSVRGWYRTYAEQLRFYNRPHSAAVAVPGYSNHGLGTAIDVSDFGGVGDFDNARRNRLYPILKKHGFTETEGRRVDEPWHLDYVPSTDKGKGKKKADRKDWFEMASKKDLEDAVAAEAQRTRRYLAEQDRRTREYLADLIRRSPEHLPRVADVNGKGKDIEVKHAEALRRLLAIVRRVDRKVK